MVKSAIDNIHKQKDMLNLLGHCKARLRKAIIRNSDKDLVDAICQCVYNVLKGNVDLSESEKHRLVLYKKTLRKLVSKSTLKEKKKILVQRGGFLEFLIPAAISGISSIISSIISSKSTHS